MLLCLVMDILQFDRERQNVDEQFPVPQRDQLRSPLRTPRKLMGARIVHHKDVPRGTSHAALNGLYLAHEMASDFLLEPVEHVNEFTGGNNRFFHTGFHKGHFPCRAMSGVHSRTMRGKRLRD